jgi:hypothetical protein
VAPLLAKPEFGFILVARSGGRIVGYLAVCLGYSIELGGKDGFVDELFVAPGSRGQGEFPCQAQMTTKRSSLSRRARYEPEAKLGW